MSHKYITLNERNKIEVLHKEGYYSRRILKFLENNISYLYYNYFYFRDILLAFINKLYVNYSL